MVKKIRVFDFATGDGIVFKPEELHRAYYLEEEKQIWVEIKGKNGNEQPDYYSFDLIGGYDAKIIKRHINDLRWAADNRQGYKLLLNQHKISNKALKTVAKAKKAKLKTAEKKICIKDYASGQYLSFKPSVFVSLSRHQNSQSITVRAKAKNSSEPNITVFAILGGTDIQQLEKDFQDLREAVANGQGYKLRLNYHAKSEKETQPTVPTEPVTTRNDVVELTAKQEADLETVPMICVKDCAENNTLLCLQRIFFP
jgi:hypothetical protein